MRRRGVFGYNLPPRNGDIIIPTELGIAGAIGLFDRTFDDPIVISDKTEIPYKLGDYRRGYYGRYVVEHSLSNAKRNPIKYVVKGYTATDAVQASATINDKQLVPAATLKILSAYQGKNDKGSFGNRTGYTITNGDRFTTTIKSTAGTIASGALSLPLTSVADVRVGDILRVNSAVVQYVKVTAIDEFAKSVTIASATTSNILANNAVAAIGFRIRVYRKNYRGLVSEVKINESKIWLSLEPENTEFYINNAFKSHPLINLADQASPAANYFDKYPVDVTTVTFLTSGSDGTAPSSSTDWNDQLAFFDTYNIRFLFNTDSTLSAVNNAGEDYCKNRLDAPLWIYNIPDGQTKDSLITLGRLYQRSDQVQGVVIYGRRNVSDPIGDGASPVVKIPNMGGTVGNWINTIYTSGVHRAPAGEDFPLAGYQETPDLVEDQWSEDDRTDILEAGVNLIQNRAGKGIILRSFRTPSTNTSAMFANLLLMQNFIKISVVESLSQAENRPNKLSKLKDYGNKARDFGFKLYEGSFPFGIDSDGAFGDFKKADGSDSQFEDVYTVQDNEFINDQTSLMNGEGNILIWFYGAPLLESLGVGVGFQIPVL